MQVIFGERTLQFPSDQPHVGLGELHDSRDLLDQPDALRARLETDGYLFIRGLVPARRVLDARGRILEYMAEREGLEPGSRPLDGVMGSQGKSVGLMGKQAITHDPAVLAAFEAPELFDFYSRLFDEPARTFDYKWLRAVGHEEFTGAHYDVVYMGRGTDRLLTCWLPLDDLPVHRGVLAICEGSHRLDGFARLRDTYGRMDVDRDRVTGWFSGDPIEITEQFGGQWKTAHFQPGDILTFGMYTLHASTTNTTDRWRLSCDIRFQPASAPIDERWVGRNPVGHYAWFAEPEKNVPMAEARARWGV